MVAVNDQGALQRSSSTLSLAFHTLTTKKSSSLTAPSLQQESFASPFSSSTRAQKAARRQRWSVDALRTFRNDQDDEE